MSGNCGRFEQVPPRRRLGRSHIAVRRTETPKSLSASDSLRLTIAPPQITN